MNSVPNPIHRPVLVSGVILTGTLTILFLNSASLAQPCDSIASEHPCCHPDGTNIVVGSEEVFFSPDLHINEGEVSVAVNPTNPDNIVIAAHGPGRMTLNAFYSTDGGRTWNLVRIGDFDEDLFPFGETSPDALHIRADPTAAFGVDGMLYIGYLVPDQA